MYNLQTGVYPGKPMYRGFARDGKIIVGDLSWVGKLRRGFVRVVKQQVGKYIGWDDNKRVYVHRG